MTVIQLLVSSLTLGCIYALVAIGLVLVFKASGLINFGAGDWVLGGGYIALALITAGVSLRWTLLLAPALGAVVGILIDRLIWRRVMRTSPWVFVVASLAVGGLIHEIVVYKYQANYFPFPALFSTSARSIEKVRYTPQNLWVVAATLIVVAALFVFFRYSRHGKALEAVAQNRVGAQIVGVNLGWALMLTWAIAGAVSAIAAVLIAPSVDVSPQMGDLVVQGFVAAAIGGLDSLGGAVVGGIVVALVESFTAVYITQDFTGTILFTLLLAIMWVRPAGLFGREVAQRV